MDEIRLADLTIDGDPDAYRPITIEGDLAVDVVSPAREEKLQTLVVRDLRLPDFHPEEPVICMPEGRAVISAFSDVVVSGLAPPIPYVAPARNGTYWYLGPLGLLLALGQSGRRVTAVVLSKETPLDELKVISAKAALLRPMHWLAEARAWKILDEPAARNLADGLHRYVATKRRRVTELLRALATLETLRMLPPHLEHRVVSAVGPVTAALDPEFSVSVLREAERHQWSVRQVLRLCQIWQASAVHHWDQRAARGLERLTPDEDARLQAAGMRHDDLPTTRLTDLVVPYPVGATGLVRLLVGADEARQIHRPELKLIA